MIQSCGNEWIWNLETEIFNQIWLCKFDHWHAKKKGGGSHSCLIFLQFDKFTNHTYLPCYDFDDFDNFVLQHGLLGSLTKDLNKFGKSIQKELDSAGNMIRTEYNQHNYGPVMVGHAVRYVFIEKKICNLLLKIKVMPPSSKWNLFAASKDG